MNNFVIGKTGVGRTKAIVINMEIAKMTYYVELTTVQVNLGLLVQLIAALMLLKKSENFKNK